MTKLLALLWLAISTCAFADPPAHCDVSCHSADQTYTYCSQFGCCGFAAVQVTTPTANIAENGTHDIEDTTLLITTPSTKLNGTAVSPGIYDSTLEITGTRAPVPMTCQSITDGK